MEHEAGFSPSQRAELEARLEDQDRTLAAMHRLEAALAEAAPGREGAWQVEVLASLAILAEATAEEYANAERPESLLSDIKRLHPRFRARVRGVRSQYRQLRDTIESLREELEASDRVAPDFADVRQRLSWALTALRHQRARESDLIYEAYFDRFRAEAGES